MNIGFMGRSKLLYEVISEVVSISGHTPAFIWTSKAEAFYECDERMFEELAKAYGCQFHLGPRVGPLTDEINFESVDVILSANFVNIIPDSFLNSVKHGVLNVHAGDLPRYQGNACPNWAILNRESEIALTVHQMSEQLDSGPIYAQSRLQLHDDTYITDVYKWLEAATPGLFIQALDMIKIGTYPTPMREGRPLRTFPRKPEDARLDWSSGIESAYCMIRASSHPFDGAFCFLNGDLEQKVTVFRAEPVELDVDICAIDGQIIEVRGQSIVISIGNRGLLLTEYTLNRASQRESLDKISSSMRNRLV